MKTIEVSEEVFEKIKDQLGESVDVSSLDDFVGQKLFIRTVTYHLVGEVVKRAGNLLELKDASWIADSGRFMNAIKEGVLDEVEPVGKCWVNTNSIIDIFPWVHPLPKEQV
jgi:hypothetical protein